MLDKKSLRPFADPGLTIPQGHGLLHAPQVDYIIRTAVKLIGHRRTLVLYVYDRKQAANGDFTPTWTMFQAGGDYITLARRDDGSTCWRTAAFERLGQDYNFTGRCTFYSAHDEQHVCDFFQDHEHGGITALTRAQQAILDRRCTDRQRKREQKTVSRMRTLHTLPRGLEGWVRRSIMPAYFRCEHASTRKSVTGVCTSCGKESTLPHAAHNDKIVCPHCNRELTVKSIGKTGRHFDHDTVQAVERTSGNEVVVRIVKVWYNYDRDNLMPKESAYENARVFMRRDPDGKVIAEPYYFSYSKGTLTHWRPGERPVFFKYSYNFEADTCAHVYCRSLSDVLTGTPWEYCPVKLFYEHFREPMQLAPFLAAHLNHPRLEHLVKVGFFNLASDLAYGRVREGTLDETQGRTHRILKTSVEDVPFLRGLDANAEALSMFCECTDAKDRQRLFLWRREHDVSRDVVQILEYVTPHKLMKYAQQQYPTLCKRKTQYGGLRYRDMQSIVSEYRDYIEMCLKLEYDMGNNSVLYPADLQKAHDRVQGRVKARADAQLRRDFETAIQAISQHLDYESDGMRIVLPASMEDLEAEGNALQHCVASYAERVAKHECVILFLRQCSNPNKPFFTVEIRNRKAVQVRGMKNCSATPEVQAFMAQWERRVLHAPAAA